MKYEFKDLENKLVGELGIIKKDKQEEYSKVIENKHVLIANILSLQVMIEREIQVDTGKA
jgi:hypothetical protein